MLADAHRRQFELVLCCALDRLSREGMVPTVLHLQRLASYGVGFHSYTEPMLSTDNEMVRDIVLAVMALLAKIERQKISERTRAGMERCGSMARRAARRSGGHQSATGPGRGLSRCLRREPGSDYGELKNLAPACRVAEP